MAHFFNSVGARKHRLLLRGVTHKVGLRVIVFAAIVFSVIPIARADDCDVCASWNSDGTCKCLSFGGSDGKTCTSYSTKVLNESPVGREADIRSSLASNNISVNKFPPCTEVGGLLNSTVNQLISLQRQYGVPVKLTGGNEAINPVTGDLAHHDTSLRNHVYGWKVDLRKDDSLSAFLTSRTGVCGNQFTLESIPPHWDLAFNLSNIDIQPGSVLLKMGQSQLVKAAALDGCSQDLGLKPEDFSYFAEDPRIATVDKIGTVTGLKVGPTKLFVAQGVAEAIPLTVTLPDPPPNEPGGQWQWDPNGGGGTGAWVWVPDGCPGPGPCQTTPNPPGPPPGPGACPTAGTAAGPCWVWDPATSAWI